MSGAPPPQPQPPRARPLSGGLWSLLSWLRRVDGGSSDSLSSAGSDRTVASFAFLSPAHCRHAAPAPRAPPSPPTASYRRRVRDRDLRRTRDRDLTLHRKYGLHCDLDAASLLSVRRPRTDADEQGRDRRAFSETLQRRAHVPGKRRAPPPPGTSATLPSRHSRKRRAPQPPIQEEKAKENIVEVQNTEMNPRRDGKNVVPDNVSTEYKSGQYDKKEATDAITKQDKNFFKQIFDSKKRRSAIETSSIKILPSISELDKQAAELIESCRLKEQNNNILNVDQREDPQNSEISKGPRWICITCLRRFDVSVNRCSFCSSSEQKPKNYKTEIKNESTFTQTGNDLRVPPIKNVEDVEREKLKKMLKEMKDSLPKKHKPHEDIVAKDKPVNSAILISNGPSETPTLRIGSSSGQHDKIPLESPLTSKKATEKEKNSRSENTNEIVRKILLQGNATPEEPLTKSRTRHSAISSRNLHNNTQVTGIDIQKTNNNNELGEENTITRLNTPLKISSLLNPVYIPKKLAAQPSKSPSDTSKNAEDNSVYNNKVNLDRMKVENKIPVLPSTSNSSNINKDNVKVIENKISPPVLRLGNKTTVSTQSQTSGANRKSVATNVNEINHHSRRRELINQLEKSIAEGDERAAADAAAKLAQFRLSCSVLSFTSQILGQIPNPDIATEKTAGNNGNRIPSPKVKGISNNLSSKDTVVPAASKDTEAPVGKLEKAKNESYTRKIDKPEPCCSKSVDKQTNKTDASSSQQVAPVNGSYMVSISVWIEDKNAAHGPIKLEVRRSATLGELRARAAARLGVSRALQRWIVGRTLCVDDAAPLAALAGPDLDAPFYLCLVEADAKQIPKSPIKDGSHSNNSENKGNLSTSENKKTGDVYTELMQLERQAIVPNNEAFECPVCMEECPARHGAVLRECAHAFCRACLGDLVRHGAEPAVPCPAVGCRGALQEREVRALVSRGEYERWLARGLAAAESGTRDAFHCRTRDCTGWALCEAGVTKFPCPVCKRNNCVPCQAIHEGETCEQYRSKLQEASSKVTNQADEGTKALLDSLISRGEALECPECSAIITKKWGCDWVKCSACKTEICWVTRGRRWGPAGRGDTSAGCRCGVDGKRCHPSCGYCH